MITELASRGASQVGAGDLAILAEHAAAHRAAVLDGDDERDDQPVEAEGGPKGPNEHHANVELGLPRGVLHANLARHAHGQAGRQVAQPDRQPRAEVGVAGEERVGGRAVLWRGDVGGDDHRDDEAKDAADTREDDGHDGLHHHLGLHLVARQFGDGGEADGRLPRPVRSPHVPEDQREGGADEAEEGRMRGAVGRIHRRPAAAEAIGATL
mmetsp:Transcript_51650/g.171159  ORF Transcript_51650/g.171159 Transcript_51650/m.171159 type:complete len:211 (+) Transcript_51650:262-894(+)